MPEPKTLELKVSQNPEILARCLNYQGDRTKEPLGSSDSYFPRRRKTVYPCKKYEHVSGKKENCFGCLNRRTFSGEYPNQVAYVLRKVQGV